MLRVQTGPKHFRAEVKKARHSNPSLAKTLKDLIDNAFKKATLIKITTTVDENRLRCVCVSDDIELGFENTEKTGIENPFNFGYESSAHSDDLVTSEFGTGMKSGATAAADQFNIYSRILTEDGSWKYIDVSFDILSMCDIQDVVKSYSPNLRIITQEEYRVRHPFEQGSTIKLSNIRECIYPRTTQEDIGKFIYSEVSATYARYIAKGINIEVNGKRVEPAYDFFEDPKCKPFTVTKKMYVLEKGVDRLYLFRKTPNALYEYNSKKDKLEKTNKSIPELMRVGYNHVYAPNNDTDSACMELDTTIVMYSDMFHRQDGKDLPMPEDTVFIYKDDRCYGKNSPFTHNNGCQNYTVHQINFLPKNLGKDLGMTYDKDIKLNKDNELKRAILSALEDSKKGFTSDTGKLANVKLCQKALDLGILNRETCPLAKLAKVFRPSESTSGSDADSAPRSRSKKSKKQVQSSAASSASSSSSGSGSEVVVPSSVRLNQFFNREEDSDAADYSVTVVEVVEQVKVENIGASNDAYVKEEYDEIPMSPLPLQPENDNRMQPENDNRILRTKKIIARLTMNDLSEDVLLAIERALNM